MCASRCHDVRTSQPRRSQRVDERAVVVEVLLGGAARDRRRDARREPAASVHLPDEARDAGEARRSRPRARRSAGGRSCPTGGTSPPNSARVAEVRVQRRERAEARAEQHRRPVGRRLREHRRARGRPRARSRSARTRSTSRCDRPAAAGAPRDSSGTSPKSTRWSSSRTSDEYSAYSGPSWTISSGSGRPGSVSAADQSSAGTCRAQAHALERQLSAASRARRPRRRPRRAARSRGTRSRTSSPNGPGARSGFAGSGPTSRRPRPICRARAGTRAGRRRGPRERRAARSADGARTRRAAAARSSCRSATPAELRVGERELDRVVADAGPDRRFGRSSRRENTWDDRLQC